MSHSPLLNLPGPSAELLDDINGRLAETRSFVAEFDPELVVIFSPDHYNGFFYRLMPPFCIGTAAAGVGDYGTHAGPLNVPAALANEMAAAVWDAGVDVSLSAAMDVDHGTVQPLEVLFGSENLPAAAPPVIPVFINSVATPLGPLKRTGRWAARSVNSLAPWTNECLSSDPVGCPMTHRCRRWRLRHPRRSSASSAGRRCPRMGERHGRRP